ncbi:hypothetical protein ACFQV2_31595 [Actinokineospora soli]|uniref:Uncharacterized protein n=1 Tax=Actinokineospora soli TaxID=1048753 RepID=A0ABW2TW17_9PSEU
MKGAVRSLHETVAGGCVRVFDGEFVPRYRDAAVRSVIGDVVLAVVHRMFPEGPPEVMLCEPGDPEWDRLDQTQLESLHRQSPLCSGERFTRAPDGGSGVIRRGGGC